MSTKLNAPRTPHTIHLADEAWDLVVSESKRLRQADKDNPRTKEETTPGRVIEGLIRKNLGNGE